MVFDSNDLTYLQRCYHFTPRQMDVSGVSVMDWKMTKSPKN